MALALRVGLKVSSEVQGTRSQAEQPKDQLGERGEEHEHFETGD